MKLKNKEKVEVHLTIAVKKALKDKAVAEDRTMAEIIKRALEIYLK